VTEEQRLNAAEIRNRAARGVVSVGMRNVVVRLLGLGGMVALTRLLTPHQVGMLAFGLAVKSTSDVLASGGLAASLIRRPEPPSRDELRVAQGAQLTTTCALTAALVLGGFAFGGVVAIAAVMALSLPVYAIRAASMVLLERGLDWSLPARIEITETFVYNLAAVGAVAAGAGPMGAAVAVPAQALTGTALLLWRGPLGLVRPRFSLREALPMLKFGVQFQSVTLISSIREQGVNIVVGAVGGLATVGIWTVAYKVLQPIGLVLQSLWRVAYPSAARILEAGEDPRRLTLRSVRLIAVVVGLPAVLIAGTAPDLITSVFGARWADAAEALPWGAAALMVSGSVTTFPIGFLGARGDTRSMVRLVGAQTFVWLAGAAVLVPILGVRGAGIAMFAGAVAQAIVTSRAMQRHAAADAVLPMMPPAAIAAVASTIAWFVSKTIEPAILGLAASGLIGAAVYIAGVLVFRRPDVIWIARLARGIAPRPVRPRFTRVQSAA
jgi:O-antigen/teichoic acid export membrane protein